jgi:ATP-dependent DNA helicase RecG
LGLNQSGRPISLRFLSLVEHLDVILDARELCEAIYAERPDDRGMAILAGQFTGTDRIDYLDKA